MMRSMVRRSRHPLLIAPALLAAIVAAGSVAAQSPPSTGSADSVTIYRCTDARGKLTLQDAPCRKGDAQQAQQMLRPRDPPPRPVITAAPISPMPAPAPPAQTLIVRNPQPLFECVQSDGTVYTSDTGDGNPRWVPIWAVDDPYVPYYPIPLGGPVGGVSYRSEQHISTGPAISATIGRHTDNSSAEVRIDSRPVEPADPYSRHRRHPRYPAYGYGYGAAGTWVRDECHALPQMEVCERLRDRRDEIRRRFFNAQPTERATLDREQRGINARLSADCGGS
jgi:hypothetical protein